MTRRGAGTRLEVRHRSIRVSHEGPFVEREARSLAKAALGGPKTVPGERMQLEEEGGWVYTKPDSGVRNGNSGSKWKSRVLSFRRNYETATVTIRAVGRLDGFRNVRDFHARQHGTAATACPDSRCHRSLARRQPVHEGSRPRLLRAQGAGHAGYRSGDPAIGNGARLRPAVEGDAPALFRAHWRAPAGNDNA